MKERKGNIPNRGLIPKPLAADAQKRGSSRQINSDIRGGK